MLVRIDVCTYVHMHVCMRVHVSVSYCSVRPPGARQSYRYLCVELGSGNETPSFAGAASAFNC